MWCFWIFRAHSQLQPAVGVFAYVSRKDRIVEPPGSATPIDSDGERGEAAGDRRGAQLPPNKQRSYFQDALHELP